MNSKLIFSLIFALFICRIAANDVKLRIDSGGHSDIIRDIVVTKDSKYVISASDDKTIRVWDIERKKEERKILSNIGKGDKGKIYTIALSNDDRLLASGGYDGLINLFDFNSGKMLYSMSSNEYKSKDYIPWYIPKRQRELRLNPANYSTLDLSFSADDKYLVSAHSDNYIRIWNTDSHSLSSKVHLKNCIVYITQTFQKDNKQYIVSGGSDEKLYLIDLKKGEKIKRFDAEFSIHSTAVSDSYIAASSKDSKKILIFDLELNYIKTIISKTIPSGLAFSPDNNYLLTGTKKQPRKCSVYDCNNNFDLINSYNVDNSVFAVSFLDNDTAIIGGGTNFKIIGYNIFSNENEFEFCGKGQNLFSAGLKDNKIYFGHKFTKKQGKSKLTKYFDLKDFKIVDLEENIDPLLLNYPKTEQGIYHIERESDFLSDKLIVFERDSKIGEIIFDKSNGIKHKVYGFTQNNKIITCSSNGIINGYDIYGRKIGDFIGVTGTIWSMAIDGDYMVTASSDNIIRLWNITEIDKVKTEGNFDRYENRKIYPTLSFFISKDDEWVAWNQRGYYDASLKGDRFIGYYINKGINSEAQFLTINKFQKSHYNPYIIRELTIGLSNSSLSFENDLSNIAEIINKLPPEIELVSPIKRKYKTKKDSVTVQFYVHYNDEKNDTEINILLNERPINCNFTILKKRKNYNLVEVNIPLFEKNNIISISANNLYAISNSINLSIDKKKINELPPTLVFKQPETSITNIEGNKIHLDFYVVPQPELTITEIDIFINNQKYPKKINWEEIGNKIFVKQNIKLKESTNEIKIIAHGSNSKISERSFKIIRNITEDITESPLPPIIKMNYPTSDQVTTSEKEITLDFDIVPQTKKGIPKISIIHNSSKLKERGIMIKKTYDDYIHYEHKISLFEGNNLIKLIAFENDNIKSEFTIIITKINKMDELYKPDLYILSVGVTDYLDDDLDLNYAAEDAKSISETFNSQKYGLYNNVNSKVLIDDFATKDNVLDGLDFLMNEATQRDVVIIFLAGHGVNDISGNFYFLCHDTDISKLRRTGLKWSEFEDVVINLPSKAILLVDACHSGNIMGSKRDIDINGAIKSLMVAGTGQVIMTATTGNSYSYEEDKWKHGAFTKSLIDGFNGQADYDDDKIISIKEIDLFVTKNVKKLTKGKQKPTTIIPESMPDFPIYLKK